ncbi:MAG: tetratricopeptide repeat protein [Cyanobacteria bacterium P01_D01_bin.73]
MDQQYDALIAAGRNAAKDKNWAEAIAQFSAAIDLYPTLAEGFYRRALAQFDAGQSQLAAFDYGKALELLPDYPEALYGRALTRVVLGHLVGAIADLTRLIEISPDHAAAHELQGTVLRKQGKRELAVNSFRKAAELYLDRRLPEDVKRCLAQMEKLKPKTGSSPTSSTAPEKPAPLANPEQFYGQCLERAEKGDAKGAMAELDWAMELDGQDGAALTCRGIVKLKLEDWMGAIADFNAALQVNSDDMTAVRNRARAKLLGGDFGGAQTDLERAASANPDDPFVFAIRGEIAQAKGDYLGAIKAYGEAIERDDQKPKFYLARAQAYTRIEELKRALEDYQSAATFYSENDQWDEYRKTLEAMKKLQSSVPSGAQIASAENTPAENPLKQRLRYLVGGQWALAERLIDQAKAHWPGMPEDWYVEKVLYDLERDRPD